jgi:hypothetical protein
MRDTIGWLIVQKQVTSAPDLQLDTRLSERPAHNQAARHHRVYWSFSQTAVCERIERARRFLRNPLPPKCFRITLKGKQFINDLLAPFGSQHAYPCTATAPVLGTPG